MMRAYLYVAVFGFLASSLVGSLPGCILSGIDCDCRAPAAQPQAQTVPWVRAFSYNTSGQRVTSPVKPAPGTGTIEVSGPRLHMRYQQAAYDYTVQYQMAPRQ